LGLAPQGIRNLQGILVKELGIRKNLLRLPFIIPNYLGLFNWLKGTIITKIIRVGKKEGGRNYLLLLG